MNFKSHICNHIMVNGNKQTSEKLFLKSVKNVQKTENKKKLKDILKTSVINSSPVVFLKHIKRKRRRTVEFPFLLVSKSRVSYGLKFILNNCRKSRTNSFYKKFNTELINSSKFSGLSLKKKNSLHQESFAKKKFANYRWF